VYTMTAETFREIQHPEIPMNLNVEVVNSHVVSKKFLLIVQTVLKT